MAARRYEMTAANEVNIFQQEKRYFVSPSGHAMFCLLYKYQLYKYHSEIVSTLTKAPLRKGPNHCVTITTVIFSHVKITCYFHGYF